VNKKTHICKYMDFSLNILHCVMNFDLFIQIIVC
jgi:hypothetical protein